MDPTDYPHNPGGFSVQIPRDIGTAEVISGAAAAAAAHDRRQRVKSKVAREVEASGARGDQLPAPATVPAPVAPVPPVGYRSPAGSGGGTLSTPAPDPIPRYRFPSTATTLARPVSTYSDEAGDANSTSTVAAALTAAALAGEPPRLVTVSLRSSNDYGAKASYGDILTAYVESNVPLESAPVLQIDGVCGPTNMTVCARRRDGGPIATGTAGNNDTDDSTGGSDIDVVAVPDWTRFTTKVRVWPRPIGAGDAVGAVSGAVGGDAPIANGPLNLTVSGYASAATGVPGPAVSGMSHGTNIIFDATPPRVVRAQPIVSVFGGGGGGGSPSGGAADGGAAAAGAVVWVGDVVTVILEASKPVRYPNVTINGRSAWVTRTAWDATSYQVMQRPSMTARARLIGSRPRCPGG